MQCVIISNLENCQQLTPQQETMTLDLGSEDNFESYCVRVKSRMSIFYIIYKVETFQTIIWKKSKECLIVIVIYMHNVISWSAEITMILIFLIHIFQVELKNQWLVSSNKIARIFLRPKYIHGFSLFLSLVLAFLFTHFHNSVLFPLSFHFLK